MDGCHRLFGLCALLGVGLLPAGCAQDTPKTLPQSRDTPLILPNLADTEARIHTARSQLPEPSRTAQPPQAPGTTQPASGPAPAPVGFDTHLSVRVRAWVNNQAIFDDEIKNRMPGDDLRQVYSLPPDQRDAALQKLYLRTLDSLIDQELLQQDALRKLEKNPKFMEEIKGEARKDADKQINAIVKNNNIPSVEAFKQGLLARGTTFESLHHLLEREYLAATYIKILIFPKLKKVGPDEIREYYDQHKNEFQTLDRVKWQDIFIGVNDKHPTLPHARQFAQQVVQQWQQGADIQQLLAYDDGTSQSRKGLGVGETKQDIQPQELAPYLFAMREGEIGPLVELSTGVHVFRLLKRENAGIMPFDEKVQQQIANKLKGEMFERERKRILRDLRDNASIEVDRSVK
jgi:hypothetical protein